MLTHWKKVSEGIKRIIKENWNRVELDRITRKPLGKERIGCKYEVRYACKTSESTTKVVMKRDNNNNLVNNGELLSYAFGGIF